MYGAYDLHNPGGENAEENPASDTGHSDGNP